MKIPSVALLCAFVFLPLQWVGAESIRIPDITGRAGPDPIRIQVESDREEVAQLAQRAFALHGGFRLVRSGGQATLRLRPVSDRAVAYQVSGRGVSHTGSAEGRDLNQAVLRATDAAVEQLTGRPGFFAGSLVFVSNRTGHKEIYTSDLLFQRVRQITRDGSKSIMPRWSPDASRILYTTYFRQGFPDLFEINLRTRDRRPFAVYRGTNTGAVFSPDGRRVAMTLSSSGNAEIYVSDPSGRSPRRLTRNNSLEATPTWSPDGRQLAFTSDQMGRPQIYVMPSDGGNMRRVQTNISGYCAEPAWNPRHPELIAFTIAQAGRFEIAIFDFRTGASTVLTQGPGDSIEPRWTNDGRHLVITRRNRGVQRLHILDIETKRLSPLHSPQFGNGFMADFVYAP